MSVLPIENKSMKYFDKTAELNINRRHLPHWTMDDVAYFLTFRVKRGELSIEEQIMVLNLIKEGDNKFYSLLAVVIMPDHVHLILIPKSGYSLSQIMKGMKGKSAREINKLRNAKGSIWQDESFDRIIRDEDELIEKLNYMLNNPLKAGLTNDAWNYHGWYFNENVEWQ